MKRLILTPLSFLLSLTAFACSTAPRTPEGKADLDQRAQGVVSRAEATDKSLQNTLRGSVGYAVFPQVGKGGAGVGGAYGKGVLYENGAAVGYCDMTQGSIGLQLGAQTYAEIIAFQTREALDRFKRGKFSFDAQASAVAIKSGMAANAGFTNSVAVFTTDEAGLMVEAAVGGQSFSYEPK